MKHYTDRIDYWSGRTGAYSSIGKFGKDENHMNKGRMPPAFNYILCRVYADGPF